jgi:hypothetical protein
MGTSIWDSVLIEFGKLNQQGLQPGTRAPWARLLEPKVKRVVDHTGVPLIIYASACTSSALKCPPALLQIDPSDKIPFHSMLEVLSGPKLDVLIHSPGGYAEATETIVEEIRRKFGYVRFIVPSYAKSAAAMMVMAGDEILMDEEAELGPIDPQMLTVNGVVPAEAIKEQFRKASEEILKDSKKVQVWFPILQALGPGILVQCDNAIQLSQELVTDWLTKYMFRADLDGKTKARKTADFLSAHGEFKSHGRRIKLEHLSPFGLNLKNLRNTPDLYRAIWELHCAVDIVLANTAIYKLFYNSANVAMVRQSGVMAPGIQLMLGQPGQGIPGPGIPIPAQPPLALPQEPKAENS